MYSVGRYLVHIPAELRVRYKLVILLFLLMNLRLMRFEVFTAVRMMFFWASETLTSTDESTRRQNPEEHYQFIASSPIPIAYIHHLSVVRTAS
jgi:hypothetical protein